MNLILRHPISSRSFLSGLRPYLRFNSEHFQHEFNCFAHSTYDMIGYDDATSESYGGYAERQGPPVAINMDDEDSSEERIEIDLTVEPSTSGVQRAEDPQRESHDTPSGSSWLTNSEGFPNYPSSLLENFSNQIERLRQISNQIEQLQHHSLTNPSNISVESSGSTQLTVRTSRANKIDVRVRNRFLPSTSKENASDSPNEPTTSSAPPLHPRDFCRARDIERNCFRVYNYSSVNPMNQSKKKKEQRQ